MKNKNVSVIIPNYNYGHFIGHAITSALSQTCPPFEVIVINNGSTDDSLETLKTFGTQIQIIDQANLGQAGARNSGLRNFKGDFVAFLDADDYWEPEKLELQLRLVNVNTEFVFSGINRFNNLQNTSPEYLEPFARGNRKFDFLDYPGVSTVLSGESSSLFSKSVFQKVGFFDTRLNSTSGWDYFRRCAKYTDFDFINMPLVNYRIHESNMSRSYRSVVADMRKAYAIALADEGYSLNRLTKAHLNLQLEIQYLKTFLKEKDTTSAIEILAKFPSNLVKYFYD
jgi:glycosyltransferase involved in cell wall biosynthesis